MASDRTLNESGALIDSGAGVRFTVCRARVSAPAFVVRSGGAVHAFVNWCTHRSVEPDWEPGHFFDVAGQFRICATHGALYDPVTGKCIAGPCRGAVLAKVPVTEVGGKVCLVPDTGSDVA